MEIVTKSLAQAPGHALLVLGVAWLALAVFTAGLWLAHRRQARRLRALLQGTQAGNLETLLMDHLRERLAGQSAQEDTARRLDALETLARTAKRHVGLVRYDAFEDVAGAQSFALAVYDDAGDGAILTGIVGRTDCRVYCKPLQGGRGERDLSQEELRAVREAREARPKALVSP